MWQEEVSYVPVKGCWDVVYGVCDHWPISKHRGDSPTHIGLVEVGRVGQQLNFPTQVAQTGDERPFSLTRCLTRNWTWAALVEACPLFDALITRIPADKEEMLLCILLLYNCTVHYPALLPLCATNSCAGFCEMWLNNPTLSWGRGEGRNCFDHYCACSGFQSAGDHSNLAATVVRIN